MTGYTGTAAWKRGVAAAEADLALMPPDDGTIDVSLDRHGSGDDRPWFKLCLTCHRDRSTNMCACGQNGAGVQSVDQRSARA